MLCSAQNTDVASLAALPKYTCGHLYYHPRFIGQRDAPKLRAELHRNLTRPTGWEAVMRIRTSRGLRVSAFHGHFFVRSSDLLALPQVTCPLPLVVYSVHGAGGALQSCWQRTASSARHLPHPSWQAVQSTSSAVQ